MAKQFRALSNIQHGEESVDGEGQVVNTVTNIPYGAVVEGLPVEVMKNLWDAGVLEEVETATPVVTKTVTPVAPPAAPVEVPKSPNTPESPKV